MGQFKDLSGQQFGEITVLEKDIELSAEKSRVYWKCQCSCGRTKSIRADGLKKIKEEGNYSFEIEVDGGATQKNVEAIIKAGAEVIVAGSAVFKGDIAANVKEFKDIFDRI